MASDVLSTGTDSPVSAASSAFILAHSIIRASAGTASPASRTITSPTTRSSLFTTTSFPSLMTFDVAAAIFCNASMAFSALLSCTTPRTALMMTTAIIMMTSDGNSFLPPEELLTAVRIPEIIAATMSISVIGSINCFNKRRIIGSFLPSASLFLPFDSRRDSASCEVMPSTPVFTSRQTSSMFSR